MPGSNIYIYIWQQILPALAMVLPLKELKLQGWGRVMASMSVQTMCGRFRIHVRKFWVHSVWSNEGKAMETRERWKYRTMGLLLRTAAHVKTSCHSTVVVFAIGSRVAEMRSPSPFQLRWFLFKFYGLDRELQNLVFVLLDIGFALANISLLCAYSLSEWEWLLCITVWYKYIFLFYFTWVKVKNLPCISGESVLRFWTFC